MLLQINTCVNHLVQVFGLEWLMRALDITELIKQQVEARESTHVPGYPTILVEVLVLLTQPQVHWWPVVVIFVACTVVKITFSFLCQGDESE